MKTYILICLLIAGALIPTTATAQGPGTDLVQEGITAFNNQDIAYFERNLADDAVWLDEDVHAIGPKERVLGFLGRRFSATPPLQITPVSIQTGATEDSAWAYFRYSMSQGDEQVEGLNTTVFRKVGNDWQIVLIHGALNGGGHEH